MRRFSTPLAMTLLAASLAITAGPAAATYRTTIDFSITPSIADEGQSVVLRAYVFGLYPPTDPPGHGPPLVVNGLVHFWDMTSNVEVGSATLHYDANDENVCSFTYGPLSGSSRMMAARFYGDITYDPSASALVQLTINVPTAIVLAQFDVTPGPDGIELRWSFVDASRVSSTVVERSRDAAGPWVTILPELRRDGDMTAALDRTTEPGQAYFYRLDANLADGSSVTFGPISSIGSARTGETAVNVVAPNPTRAASQIQYTVARVGRVRLEVTDVAGRVMATLFDGVQQPGRFQVSWDGTNRGERLPAGLYLARLTTPDRTVSRKIARLQ
jgi:hypothetical protein